MNNKDGSVSISYNSTDGSTKFTSKADGSFEITFRDKEARLFEYNTSKDSFIIPSIMKNITSDKDKSGPKYMIS